jgi:hypothetical protein
MADNNKVDDLTGKNIILLNTNSNPFGKPQQSSQIQDKPEIVNENPKVSIASSYDTLDEPVIETLKRDFISIYHKLLYVLIPRTEADQNKNLRNCKIIY